MALNHAIASDLSYECFQKRRREVQIAGSEADERTGLTQLPVQRPVIRFWDAGEGHVLLDPGDDPQTSDAEPTPTWAWHGRGRR